jgi:crotonobetainyl-CoA:carnitine CoA-transferase CaiB-like acyl-CoA transferase
MTSDPGAAAPSASTHVPLTGPLRGLKVLDLGHFFAGPFCTRLLADQGATVIKVEPPGGEPLRHWGAHSRGHSVTWSVINRNKLCITLDVKRPSGRPALERLIGWADVVVENFRPGQIEKWKLGFAEMQAINPRVILVRISGYGQDGPYRDRHAFGAVGEAMGGVRYLTGYPLGTTDLPPVRTGIALGDDVTSLYGFGGILAAVYERDVTGTGVGRQLDIALYEGMFSLLEGILPEYGTLGTIREPQGSAMPTAVPTDTYRTADGAWLVIAGNSDPIFRRLCHLIGRADMAENPEYNTNVDRLANRAVIDQAIARWVATVRAQPAERMLNEAGIPASRAFTIKDCVEDPHFQAREMVLKIQDPLIGDTLHPGIVPKFDSAGSVGAVAWPGPAVGADNQFVYDEILGFPAEQRIAWEQEGVL